MSRALIPLVAMLLFTTGGSALVYELAWARWLTLTLGASAPGVAVTVASTMLGFAAGAGLLSPRIDASSRPLRAYGLLELAVAFSAAIVSVILRDATTASWSVALPPALLFLLVLVLVGIPTSFMGATLPAVVGFVGKRAADETRGALGILYACNTAGAVVGTLVTGFVLMEHVGLTGAAALGISLNGVVGVVALVLDARLGPAPAPRVGPGVPALALAEVVAPATDTAPREPASDASDASALEPTAAAGDPPPAVRSEPASALLPASHALFAAGVSGFGVMAHEVLATRFLVYGFYATPHAIAIILAVYLAGLAIAAAIVARPLQRGEVLPWHVGAALVGAGLVAVAFTPSLMFVAELVDWLDGDDGAWTTRVLVMAATSAVLLLPPVLVMGAVFPLAAGISVRADAVGASVGRAVLVNTLAGAAGALGAAFVLMPALGARGAVAAVCTVQVGAGAWLLWRHGPSSVRALGWAGLALGVLVGGWVARPVESDAAPGTHTPMPVHLVNRADEYRIRWYREGATATTEVHEHLATGHRHVLIDGFVAAGQGRGFGYMWMIGAYPMLLHPAPERALVICFGTGTTARAVAYQSESASIDVVDINPDVIACAETTNPDNGALLRRARVHIEDGRAFLRRGTQRYDVIAQEPMPPHFAGVSALYSVEYYRSARARLADDGILVQWLPMHLTAPDAARTIAAAALEVFPETWLVISPKDFTGLLVMSPRPIAEARLHEVDALLLTETALDPAGVRRFVDGAPPLTDDRPTIEYNGWDRVRDDFPAPSQLRDYNLVRVLEASGAAAAPSTTQPPPAELPEAE